MKKHLITLFLALASVINLHAAITYEHDLDTAIVVTPTASKYAFQIGESVELDGVMLESNLTMSAASTEAIVVVVEDATVQIDTISLFGDQVDYSLKMTANWTYAEDGVTYPVLVEVPIYYPKATEPYEIMSTVTVGGMGDDDPWLGFGEGTLTITTVDGLVTATGIVQNPMAGVTINITISGKLSTSETSSPTAITYELNGGVTNDYGWMSKGDMFTACITDALGYDLGMTLDEFKRSNTPFDDLFPYFDIDHCQNILDNARWDWLEEYLMMVQKEDQLAATLTAGVASQDWRYAIAAFFFESQYDTSLDYTDAGKDEAYIPYWKHGYDNPTQTTREFTLNAPYKENHIFEGWFATPDFSSAVVKTINASTSGTLYAKWKERIEDVVSVKDLSYAGARYHEEYYGTASWAIQLYNEDETGESYEMPCVCVEIEAKSKTSLNGTYDKLLALYGTTLDEETYEIDGVWSDETIAATLTIKNVDNENNYSFVGTFVGKDGKTYNINTIANVWAFDDTGEGIELKEDGNNDPEVPCEDIHTEETITACDSYQWNGQTYTKSGDYTYSTTAINGCDSIVTLHLTINKSSLSEELELFDPATATLDSYYFAPYWAEDNISSASYNAISGTITVDIKSQLHAQWQGAVRIKHNVSFDPAKQYIFSAKFHSTATIDDVTVKLDDNVAIVYDNQINLPANADFLYTSIPASGIEGNNKILIFDFGYANPCSISISEISIREVGSIVASRETATICYGETYTWNDQTYSAEGEYSITLSNVNGCDSVATLQLTIMPEATTTTETVVIGSDELPYTWRGNTYSATGQYTVIEQYTTVACDSAIHVLDLTVLTTGNHDEQSVTICETEAPYMWYGESYSATGKYTYTEKYVGTDIDSIQHILNLTVNPTVYVEETITACDNYEWNGQIYTESGTYTHTSTTIDGCDSIVTLHLTINYSEVGETENVTICHGETYTWNGQTYSTAGEYSVTFSNANGCDSTATIHLTIMPQAQEEVQYETINKKETPFIWQKNGKKYYETTTDSIFIPYTHHDCDSMIYILDLTVVDIEDVRAEYDTICESALPYEWHGQSITTGGRYEYTEKYGDTNIDILHVLYLTVIPTIRTQQSATICYEETFAWNGNTYSQTGTYTYTTEAANGCDSVVTLYLTVLPPAITIYTDTMIAHVDLPYIWRGQYCDTSGEYTATIPFAANPACDSVIYVLNLTVESVNKCGADLSWEYDNGILTISGSGAMYDNPDLQSYRHESWYPYRVRQVILSDQLTHIGNVALADCANLTNIDIPSSVTSIGDGAFSWTGLQSVTIPASVTKLGEQVFEACSNLHTIIYEGYPTVISNQAIHPLIGCVHLDTVIAPAALWHCTNADKALENRYGVPHKARYIEVTDGDLTNQAVKYIAQNATALEVLDLTNTTNTTLPYGALYNSYQLTQLYLPAYIETLPESMIEGGNRLMEITIPATVTEIGNYAFAGCVNIWRMTVEATTPPKVYENTFDGISRSIFVLVPAGSEQAYREAEYWREFFIDNTNSPLPISNCQKILREDQILILREGKVYTTMGQLINTEE